MSRPKFTAKTIFLAVSTLIVAITCVVYLLVIADAFEYQKDMAERKIGDEIITIHKGVPRGWAYSIITDEQKIGSVGSLDQAVAQVDFSLPDLNEKLGGDIQKRSIYFYPRDKHEQISRELEASKATVERQCVPEYYSQTHEYIILSSSCDAFQGKQYADIERKLKMELEEFWFKFQ